MSPGAPHDAVKYDPLVFLASMRARTYRPAKHIASVVQALRGNSSRTLLLVRNGSDWTFEFDRVLSWGIADPIAENSERWEGLPDVMSQLVPFEVNDERRTSGVVFSRIWDGDHVLSMALCEAMRTNKTVRALDLYLNFGSLQERHMTAIEDSLLENDTLQSFTFVAGGAIVCPPVTVKAAFSRILERNMCLVQIDIRFMMLDHRGTGRMSDPGWTCPMDLGQTVTDALERNKRAWNVAKHLGQLNRGSAGACQNLGDIVLRRLVLCFFLANGCQEPPRQMLHIAGGLPVWRPVSRDVL